MIKKKRQQCSMCHKEVDYYYTCNCSLKKKLCRNCLFMYGPGCFICHTKYIRQQASVLNDNKLQKSSGINVFNSSQAKNKNSQFSKNNFKNYKNQSNLIKESPNLLKKASNYYQVTKTQNQTKHLQARRQIVNNFIQSIEYDNSTNFTKPNQQILIYSFQAQKQIDLSKPYYSNNTDRQQRRQETNKTREEQLIKQLIKGIKQQRGKRQQQIRKRQQDRQSKIQFQNLKRQQQDRKRQEQRQRIRLENKKMREQIEKKNKQILDRIEQNFFQKQLQRIKEIQQKEQRQKQSRQREQKLKKQQEQKRNKMFQSFQSLIKGNEKDQRPNRKKEQIKQQAKRQRKQSDIRREFQTLNKYQKSYQSKRCVACDNQITNYESGSQIDGVFLCCLCSFKNKKFNSYDKVHKSEIINGPIQKAQTGNKMMTEDQKLLKNNVRKQKIQNSKQINIYDYNPRIQIIQELNYKNRNALNKQRMNYKINKFNPQRIEIKNNQQQEQTVNIGSCDNQAKKVFVEKQAIKQENNNQNLNKSHKDNFFFKNESGKSSQRANKIKQKQDKSSQRLFSQQTFSKQQQKDNNKLNKLTCGLCFQFIDTLQKLGVKNQDGINLCKSCYQNKKKVIQNKSSHIYRLSQDNQDGSQQNISQMDDNNQLQIQKLNKNLHQRQQKKFQQSQQSKSIKTFHQTKMQYEEQSFLKLKQQKDQKQSSKQQQEQQEEQPQKPLYYFQEREEYQNKQQEEEDIKEPLSQKNQSIHNNSQLFNGYKPQQAQSILIYEKRPQKHQQKQQKQKQRRVQNSFNSYINPSSAIKIQQNSSIINQSLMINNQNTFNKNPSHIHQEQYSSKNYLSNQSQMQNVMMNSYQHTVLKELKRKQQKGNQKQEQQRHEPYKDPHDFYQQKSLRYQEAKQQKQLANFYQRQPEYSDVLTPSLRSNSVYYEMNSVSLPQILVKSNQQQKLITKSEILNQQTKKITHQLSMRQQPALSLSFHSNDMKPQRDNSGSYQNQNIQLHPQLPFKKQIQDNLNELYQNTEHKILFNTDLSLIKIRNSEADIELEQQQQEDQQEKTIIMQICDSLIIQPQQHQNQYQQSQQSQLFLQSSLHNQPIVIVNHESSKNNNHFQELKHINQFLKNSPNDRIKCLINNCNDEMIFKVINFLIQRIQTKKQQHQYNTIFAHQRYHQKNNNNKNDDDNYHTYNNMRINSLNNFRQQYTHSNENKKINIFKTLLNTLQVLNNTKSNNIDDIK